MAPVSPAFPASSSLLRAPDAAASILESIADGFFAVDRGWRLSSANRQAEEILAPLGHSRQSLEGALLWERFPSIVGTPLEADYRRAMGEGVPVEMENFFAPLGRWFSVRLFPARHGLSVFFQDITARKEAEEAVLQQREWFAVTLSSIGDAVITTDVEGKVTFLNPRAEQLTGWFMAEAMGLPLETVFHIIHEQSRLPAANPIARALREGVTVGLVNHTALIAKDGTVNAIEDSAAPIRASSGEVIGAVMVFHDVNERRQATKLLREQARLTALRADIGHALIRAATLPAVLQECTVALVKHLDGAFARIWTVNETGDLLELQASAGLYTHLDGPHGRVPVGQFKIGRIAQSGQALLTNDVAHDPNIGDPEWARREGMTAFVGYPMILEGRVLGVMAMFARQPLSETVMSELAPIADGISQWVQRKRGEEALRQSEARLRAFGDSMAHLAWTAHGDGFIHWYNRRWYEYTGTTPQEMEGWGWQSVHDPEVLPVVMERWQAAIGKGEPFDMTFPLRGADGAFRMFLTRVVPQRDAAGQVTQWYGTNTDISAQQETADRLRESAEALRKARDTAESASRAKDNFLAALSHELRTPLNPVLMTAAALREDESLPRHVREQFGMIERNIGLEARLIDDLLDLTRITRGKLTLRAEPCDMHSLIGLVVQLLRDEAREKQVSINLEIAAQLSGLTGDATRLQQAIWNLLRNAVKFTPPGGRICIRSLNRSHEEDPRQSLFCIEVVDDGVGLDPEVVERIFEPFEQLSAAQEHRFGGLGLGLAIARAIVDLHGGTISAASPGPGRGATFAVKLPGAAVPPAMAPLPAHADANHDSSEMAMRLLVVEDHETTRQVLVRLLARAGHHVVSAGSLAEARAAAGLETFDLVVSDLGLPDGTGVELMEELRAAYGLRGVALTGYGMEDDLRRTLDAGFVAHLVKPVDFNELRRVLRQFHQEA